MNRSVSKVDQIVREIRLLIDESEDGRLPSEPEMAERVGASRATVRQALARLEGDGLIIRKHGVGTFVNEHVLNIGTRLEEVWDFFEMIEMSGHTVSIHNQLLTLGAPPEAAAQKLGLLPDGEVITAGNIFLADDIPVIYCIDYVPTNLVRQGYRDEELHGPVYEFLESRCGQRIEQCVANVQPVVATTTLAELLACRLGSPLHYITEVGYNADEHPIIYSEEYYRPEFFNFTVVRKLTSYR